MSSLATRAGFAVAPTCTSLAEVRLHIDQIDRELVALLARRADFVNEAARLKRDAAEIPDPARVATVIARVRRLAGQHGLDPDLAAAVWQTMIDGFIAAEHRTHQRLHPPPHTPPGPR